MKLSKNSGLVSVNESDLIEVLDLINNTQADSGYRWTLNEARDIVAEEYEEAGYFELSRNIREMDMSS